MDKTNFVLFSIKTSQIENRINFIFFVSLIYIFMAFYFKPQTCMEQKGGRISYEIQLLLYINIYNYTNIALNNEKICLIFHSDYHNVNEFNNNSTYFLPFHNEEYRCC